MATTATIFENIPEINNKIFCENIPEGQDVFICRNTCIVGVPLNRTIMILLEPPLTEHREMIYRNAHNFHTLYTWDKHIFGDNPPNNVFSITDNPTIFPYAVPHGKGFDYQRKSFELTTREIYYAGMRNPSYAAVPDMFGNNLYPMRGEIGKWLLQENIGYPVGLGWPLLTKCYQQGQNEYTNWRAQKPIDCDNLNCDFIFSIGNYYQQGYCDERFHDGIITQRMMFYIGCSDIDKYVPPECFVNLAKYIKAGSSPLELDYKEISHIIKNISQFEYDRYINNAMQWQDTLRGKDKDYRDKLTQHIIGRING